MPYEYETNGAAIYKQSFATIRAEADLAALPKAVEPLAVRLIHACGMVDLLQDLRFSPDIMDAARTALMDGCLIITDCE